MSTTTTPSCSLAKRRLVKERKKLQQTLKGTPRLQLRGVSAHCAREMGYYLLGRRTHRIRVAAWEGLLRVVVVGIVLGRGVCEESASSSYVSPGHEAYGSPGECCVAQCAKQATRPTCMPIKACGLFQEQSALTGCCQGGCKCEWQYDTPQDCPAWGENKDTTKCMEMSDFDTNGKCMSKSREFNRNREFLLLFLYYGVPFLAFAIGLHVLCCLRRMSRPQRYQPTRASMELELRSSRQQQAHPPELTSFGLLGSLATGPTSDLVTTDQAALRTGIPFALRVRGTIIPAAVCKANDPLLGGAT